MVPGHELIEFGAPMGSGEALEGIGKPDMRVDGVELRGLDQCDDDGPVVAAIIRTGEVGVPSGEDNLGVILPILGKTWKFTTVGIRISAVSFAA